jgi:hypothetical protein
MVTEAAGNCQSQTKPLALCSIELKRCVMHKDKPPGIFDLSERSMRYAAGFCFVVGFLVAVVVRIGVVLAREHFSRPTPWSGV